MNIREINLFWSEQCVGCRDLCWKSYRFTIRWNISQALHCRVWTMCCQVGSLIHILIAPPKDPKETSARKDTNRSDMKNQCKLSLQQLDNLTRQKNVMSRILSLDNYCQGSPLSSGNVFLVGDWRVYVLRCEQGQCVLIDRCDKLTSGYLLGFWFTVVVLAASNGCLLLN